MAESEIGPEEVVHIATLARLDLSAEEIETFSHQLSAVLEHVAAIRRLDVADLVPMHHTSALENVLRADEVRPGLSRSEVLAAAPAAESDRFSVPRILAEEQ
jgi:aspartyl-tRNA(Asn)/glutamyl-tRNA(Gln) amidotransferase subunit C